MVGSDNEEIWIDIKNHGEDSCDGDAAKTGELGKDLGHLIEKKLKC